MPTRPSIRGDSAPSDAPQSVQAWSGGPELVVDLAALAANYRFLKKSAGDASTAAAIKADGYGLGAEAVAGRLAREGATDFFVAHPEEALPIRRLLPAATIYVLHGFRAAAAALFAQNRLRPVICTAAQLSAYRQSGLAEPAALHFDTGMARLGLTGPDAKAALADASPQNRDDIALVMSHLACGDDPADPMNNQQLARFTAIAGHFPQAQKSLAASGGILIGRDYAFDLTRPGIGLYGGNPHISGPNPMQSVVTLRAPILQVHAIEAGTPVGYGATYRAPGPRQLAVVGIGYADGLPRSLSNRGYAMVAGIRCDIVGRVSMDLVTLDVSTCPAGAVTEAGAWAEFTGPSLPVDTVAALAGTAAYEILTGIGGRVQRRYEG